MVFKAYRTYLKITKIVTKGPGVCTITGNSDDDETTGTGGRLKRRWDTLMRVSEGEIRGVPGKLQTCFRKH